MKENQKRTISEDWGENPLRNFEKRYLMTYKMVIVQKFCVSTFQNIKLRKIMVYKLVRVYILHLAFEIWSGRFFQKENQLKLNDKVYLYY